MKLEDYDSKVNKGYVSALDYLTIQSQRVVEICNNLNSLTAVAHVQAHTSYSPISNPNIITIPNKDVWVSSVPSSFVVKNESLQYAEVKASVGIVQSHLNEFSLMQSFLPNIENTIAVSPMVGYAREATSAFIGLSKQSTINYLASSIENNISPWYGENIAGLANQTSLKSGIDIIQTSKYVGSILGKETLSTFAIQASLVKASEYSVFAEKSILAVTAANIGSKIYLPDDSKRLLSNNFGEFSNGYASFIKSYEQNPLLYTYFDPSISKMVPSEYFLGANLLESISVNEEVTTEEEELKAEIQYENEILLSSYLPRLDPRLLKLWKGAIEAYHSNNSDRIRHFSASLRELFTHVIQRLAPDPEIKKWSSDPNLYSKNRPTRKARLLYICRNIKSDPFNSFVDLDINTTLSFIDIFQKGTHEIEPSFSQNQLLTIKSKAESTLKFLLEIHFKTKN